MRSTFLNESSDTGIMAICTGAIQTGKSWQKWQKGVRFPFYSDDFAY